MDKDRIPEEIAVYIAEENLSHQQHVNKAQNEVALKQGQISEMAQQHQVNIAKLNLEMKASRDAVAATNTKA